jgi:hypothetical protein
MKQHRVKKNIKTKAGIEFHAGENGRVEFPSDSMIRFIRVSDGAAFHVRTIFAANVITGIGKVPNIERLSEDSGTCATPSGYRVEPDGHGPDGSPSWLLVLGVI